MIVCPFSIFRGNGAETDPNLAVKRSSYSYVSKSASSSNGNTGGGLSSKRPLAVRGLLPTQHSDNSLNSHNTGNSASAAATGTFGAIEETSRASINAESTGLDSNLQVDFEPELAVETPAPSVVPASVLASIEVITPMARGNHQSNQSRATSTSTSSAAFADAVTAAEGGNIDTEEFVTSESIEASSVPEMPLSTGHHPNEPSALRSEDPFEVTDDASADVDEVQEESTPADQQEEEPSESSEPSSSNAKEEAGEYSADVSREEDEEDFQVMSDRGAGHSNRHFRVKRSVDPTTLQFSEQYDGSEPVTPVSTHRSPALSLDSEQVKAGIAAVLEEQVRKLEQSSAQVRDAMEEE